MTPSPPAQDLRHHKRLEPRPDSVRASRQGWLAVALACAALLAAGSWWRDAQPVAMAAGAAGKLRCLSYAPSGAPTHPAQDVTRERLREDLEVLARRTSCIRTYTVSHGFDAVPAIAAELGLEVLLGAWIGSDAAHNEREVALVIETARRHREAIRAVVVGNEVMLRHELPAEQLAALIRRVGQATGLPVTYADVWGFWLKHRVLSEAVSFVTVHIIPYWDDEPVGIDAVIPYVDELYREMQRSFPGHAVLIGETGWPSAGRPRGAIEPGRVNQARYLREFTALAKRRAIDYNLIEAFDQPWKRAPEGTVGGFWGLHDSRQREKFPWSGPVAEAPRGRAVAIASFAAGAAGALGGWLWGGVARRRASLALAAGATLLVAIGACQFDFMAAGNISWTDWLATSIVVVTGWTAFGIAVRSLFSANPVDDLVPRWLLLLLLACSAYVCLGLVFAGRHRDFPVWLFLPGVLGLAITAALAPASRAARLLQWRASEEILLATWLLAAGCLIPLLERLQNSRSLGWGASSVVLGLSVLVPLALQSCKDQRPAEHADGRPREAVEHHADRADRNGEAGRQG